MGVAGERCCNTKVTRCKLNTELAGYRRPICLATHDLTSFTPYCIYLQLSHICSLSDFERSATDDFPGWGDEQHLDDMLHDEEEGAELKLNGQSIIAFCEACCKVLKASAGACKSWGSPWMTTTMNTWQGQWM